MNGLKSTNGVKRRFWIFTLAAAAWALSSQVALPAGVDDTFGSLFGKWRGSGVIVPGVDKPAEKISCRVEYKQSSATSFSSHIRCAAVDFNINASGRVTYSSGSGMYQGRLQDRGTGWTLVLSGGRERSSGVRFALHIPEAKVNGWLSMDTRNRRRHTWTAQRTTSSGLKQLLQINFRR
jgi:hypothetical protein